MMVRTLERTYRRQFMDQPLPGRPPALQDGPVARGDRPPAGQDRGLPRQERRVYNLSRQLRDSTITIIQIEDMILSFYNYV